MIHSNWHNFKYTILTNCQVYYDITGFGQMDYRMISGFKMQGWLYCALFMPPFFLIPSKSIEFFLIFYFNYNCCAWIEIVNNMQWTLISAWVHLFHNEIVKLWKGHFWVDTRFVLFGTTATKRDNAKQGPFFIYHANQRTTWVTLSQSVNKCFFLFSLSVYW